MTNSKPHKQPPKTLNRCRERWNAIRTSTRPVRRPHAENAVIAAYRAAGLEPPREIIWCQSPVEIEKSRKHHWYDYCPGRALRSRLVDDVIAAAYRAVERRSPGQYSEVARRLALGAEPTSSELSVGRAISRAVDGIRWHISDYTRAVRCWVSGRGPINYIHFDYCRWAPYESAGALATLEYLRDKLGFESEIRAASGLMELAQEAGWAVAHENICWLSERPRIWSVDLNGRLHSAAGPALKFRDGWSEHSWKGVSVPQWAIDHPDEITAAIIEEQGNIQLRQALIDIMTPAKFIASGAAAKAASDCTGVLWRREWSSIHAWAAVEVINGTPEPDGSHKHYFLQVPPALTTPTEAVAWTYGLTADRYAALALRT